MGLRHIFGNKPIPRVIDFLRVHREWDYPLATIAEATGVSYRTLQTLMPLLLKLGIVKRTRLVGRMAFFKLNFALESVRKLDEFAICSDLEFGESIGRKQHAPIVAHARRR